jgi:hypothetical protein
MIKFKRGSPQPTIFKKPSPQLLTLIGLAAVFIPHVSASGVCLSVGGPVFGGAILATENFAAGCAVGLSSNAHGGAVTTTTPTPLPSPITLLTTGTLGYSDPTGTINTATASLNAGKLGAFDFGSLTGGNNGPLTSLSDVVHFSITDGAPSVNMVVKLDLNGTETGAGFFNNILQLSFGGSLGYQMDNGGGHPGNFSLFSNNGWISPVVMNETQNGLDFSGTLNVTNGEALPLQASLALACVSGETCDFSHTAALSFALPSDLTFTSDSGVLLTQTSSAAPEPASLALIGGGLVVLAVLRRKTLLR